MSSGSERREPGVDSDTLVAVGVIRRAHGVRGEASVEPLTDSASRFDELDRVYLVDPARTRVVESAVLASRPHKERALVALSGLGSPEEIARFRDWTIEVPEDEARELDDNEYFIHDLVGLAVIDRDGTALGRVIDVLEGAAQVLLRIEQPAGGRFEIPFVAALCPEVDLDRGRITVELPDGLIDLNSEDKR